MSLKKKDWNIEKRIALPATNIVAKLAQLSGWKLSGDGDAVAIEKIFHFKNYFETIAFVNAVALVAHKEDHHPELVVLYDHCTVRLNTHDVHGLSSTDFECAAQIEALLA